MKMSTKGRYGVRAMFELAGGYGEEPVKLRRIAARQDISARYLERMMNALVGAGLVRSIRGRNGGFQLVKPPADITLNMVVQAVEGSMAPVACVDDVGLCCRHESCAAREVWMMVKRAVVDVLDSITLEDMLLMQRKKRSDFD